MSKMRWEFIRTLLRWDSFSKNTSETASSRFTPPEIAHLAKTLNFFVATSGLRLLTAKLKDFAFLSRDAVIARCSLGLRSGRLRGAVFHNARSLRYAQRVFAKHLKSGAESHAVSRQGFATVGDCACPASRTDSDSGLWGNVIICAVLAVLSAVPIPHSHSESRTPCCGYADHHIAS